MIETRLAFARLLTSIAMFIMPDGKPKSFLLLWEANASLRADLTYVRKVRDNAE